MGTFGMSTHGVPGTACCGEFPLTATGMALAKCVAIIFITSPSAENPTASPVLSTSTVPNPPVAQLAPTMSEWRNTSFRKSA